MGERGRETCVSSKKDRILTELPQRVLSSLSTPTPTLAAFLLHFLSLNPQLQPFLLRLVLLRGRQPLGTALCGFDRAGRQIQHAKSSGPFEMSRQEARLGEKQGHSPLASARRLLGRLLPLLQEPRGSVPGGLIASSGSILMEVNPVPCPGASAARVCQVEQTCCLGGEVVAQVTVAHSDLEVEVGRVDLASGIQALISEPVLGML